MKLDLLLTTLKKLEENGGYRAHLAKPAGCLKPLEVLARCDEEWKEWQNIKGILRNDSLLNILFPLLKSQVISFYLGVFLK